MLKLSAERKRCVQSYILDGNSKGFIFSILRANFNQYLAMLKKKDHAVMEFHRDHLKITLFQMTLNED